MDKIKIGVVGAGRLGGFHASKIAASNDAVLAGIADPIPQNRDKLAQNYSVPAFEHPEDLLPLTDAVVIAAPSTLHFETGKFFAEHGKHILMEKPLCTNSNDARDLLDIAEENNIVFQAGHVEQYNPAWISALPHLKSIQEGEKVLVDARRTSGYTFRSTDIGVVLDLMIHDIELILSILGNDIAMIDASGFSQIGGFEDIAYAQILFQNGSVARLTASRVEQSPSRIMDIRFKEKSLQIDFQSRITRCITADSDIQNGSFAPDKVNMVQMAPNISSFMNDHYKIEELVNDPVDALSLEMDNFCSAILRNTPSRVPGKRAAEAVEIAEEIIRSIQEEEEEEDF
ncbi:MAG: Gfo/Idh/MocA family oxidoreductase [Planctomycetia bacterium]|nr:Gfo/Idh/MocA family oxidoreductase [Planctomycetia bacterium]